MRAAASCVLISSLFFAVGGCASSGDVDALKERVTALEARAESDAERIAALENRMDDEIAALEASVNDVLSAADRSAERAAAAEVRARSAETRASDAARKADAIFNKSVSK